MSPRPSAEAALDSQASRYFASLDASVGSLQQRAQQLIDRVNDSRKEDHTVMSGFRESLLLKVGAAGAAGGAASEETPAHASPVLPGRAVRPCGLCLRRLIALFRPN